MSTGPEVNIHYLIEAHGNLDCAHWSDGPFCPNCGEREALRVIHGQTARPGIYHCLTCRKRFAGTLDILFQTVRRRPGREISSFRPSAEPDDGPAHRLLRVCGRAVWYGIHIVRQVILGSDARPPGSR